MILWYYTLLTTLVRFSTATLNETRAEATSLLYEWPSFMFRDDLRHLISSASVSLVSVLKRHFFNNVKFCSAALFALHVFNSVSFLYPLFSARMLSINKSVRMTRTCHIRQLFVRIENHLCSNLSSSNSAIKSHRGQCKACREAMPAEQNFTILKKCRFKTETERMEALLIKRLKSFLNIKLGHS